MLLNLSVSTLLLMFMLWVGQVLMFLNEEIYWLLPIFIIFLWISKYFYQDNCKTIEIKDFIYPLLLTMVCVYIMTYAKETISIGSICYLYVSVFLANSMYASSIRYKSLM